MSWENAVLAALGAPESEANVRALTLWAQSEGTEPAWNNPLATTLDAHGGTPVNDAGVRQYPDEPSGVAATVDTLADSRYTAVVEALKADAGLLAVYTAVNASPWCPGCQDGHYPVALWEEAHATAFPGAQPAPKAGQAIDVTDAVARKDGGVYVLGSDGGVFTYHGAPFFGSYPGLPEQDRQGQRTPFRQIQLDADEAGYTLVDESGERYHFPDVPPATP